MLHRKKSYEIKSWKAKVKIFKYSMQNELEMPKGVGNFQFVSNWQSLSSSPLFSLSELGAYTAAYTRNPTTPSSKNPHSLKPNLLSLSMTSKAAVP